MYISETNYAEAIANLEDCMFALKSMDNQIGSKGFATDEDLAYIEPRFTEALRYILTLNAHKSHYKKFREYIVDQDKNGNTTYEALGLGNSVGSIVEHFGDFLSNIIHCPKKGSE
tara:strand:+ start:1909 stop:2253 length:345 start_codon:yes stop_codon:yes gene_type:complete